ncbi:MAG: hypothetical protein DYH13_00770 [Alphaproteobacteria bacterium PRO2]|nr:hypothetical protein [Alphaproteobacteria bacterium PRO2]
MSTSDINLLNEFGAAKFKDPMSKIHMSIIGDAFDGAKTMLRIGNVDSAFELVKSAMVHARWLINSSEDFNRDQLVKYVSSRTRDLLPGFDSRDRKHILRDLATIEPSELSAAHAQQQYVALTR